MYGFQPQIFSTNQISLVNGIKICVYGQAGAGKTRLCATAPNPFIISAERGLLSLAQYDIPAVEINSITDLRNMASWMETSNEAKQYQTFCLDSISEIAETVLEHEKKNNKHKQAAYGETQEQIIAEFRRFRDIRGPHVYFAAKQFKETSFGGAAHCRPWMPGQQLPQAMPYFFDEVLQLNIGKDQAGNDFRYFRCWPDANNEAKDRSGMLDEFERPDLAFIFNKMLGVQ